MQLRLKLSVDQDLKKAYFIELIAILTATSHQGGIGRVRRGESGGRGGGVPIAQCNKAHTKPCAFIDFSPFFED